MEERFTKILGSFEAREQTASSTAQTHPRAPGMDSLHGRRAHTRDPGIPCPGYPVIDANHSDPTKAHSTCTGPKGDPLVSTTQWGVTSVGVSHARRHRRLLLLPLHRHHHLLLDPLFPRALGLQLVIRGQGQRGAGLVLEALICQRCLQWRVNHGCTPRGWGERGLHCT